MSSSHRAAPNSLKAAADKLGVKGIVADVTSDDSVVNLFRRCGPVDHVVVTAAQLKTGPFKVVAMDDVRATMESKFWGAWRCARSAEIKAGRIAHAGLRFPQRPPAAEFGDRRSGERTS